MNFAGLLRGVARRLPEHDAIVDGERRYGFRELWRHVSAVADVYRDRDIQRGDRVLLVLPNGPEFLFFHFAALKMGAVSVPVRSEYRGWEVGGAIADCRPRLLVSTDRWLEENAALIGGAPDVLSVDRLRYDPAYGDDRVPALPGAAPASINYSYFGGGHARGAVLTHANHIYAATGYARHQGFTADERFLVILPMAHVYALSGCVNSGWIRGGALVLLHHLTPRAIFRTVEQHRVTVLSAVPATFEQLVQFPHRHRYDLSSLRLCVTGGAFMSAAVQREVEAALGVRLVQGYGLTECLPVICNPPRGKNKHGTLGIPGRKDIHLRILGPGGEALPPREVGEIAIQSPTTMARYYGHPEKTAELLRGGWLHTGDEGFLDEDGYLHFCKLRKPILNIHGNKVDPQEVARVLLTHPAVEAAEVAGRPAADPRRQGETEIAAEVVLKGGQAAEEVDLRGFLRRRIASYKVPVRIAVTPGLPSSTGPGRGATSTATTAATAGSLAATGHLL